MLSAASFANHWVQPNRILQPFGSSPAAPTAFKSRLKDKGVVHRHRNTWHARLDGVEKKPGRIRAVIISLDVFLRGPSCPSWLKVFKGDNHEGHEGPRRTSSQHAYRQPALRSAGVKADRILQSPISKHLACTTGWCGEEAWKRSRRCYFAKCFPS
jgi:hypothetical protein